MKTLVIGLLILMVMSGQLNADQPLGSRTTKLHLTLIVHIRSFSERVHCSNWRYDVRFFL